MKHQIKIFQFKDRQGNIINLQTKALSFNTVRIAKSDNMDLVPFLLEGNKEDIEWKEQEQSKLNEVIIHFLTQDIECQNEAEKILQRNSCFEYRNDEDFTFHPEEYLSEEEMKEYYLHSFCEYDPIKIEFIKENLCNCELMQLNATSLTAGVRESKYNKYIQEKYKSR